MDVPASKSLKSAIDDKSAVIGILGLGYVGLPLINAFITAGFKTIGFDVDQKKIEMLANGQSYIGHISSDQIQAWTSQQKFSATADMKRIAEADALLVCVPTPLNESRDPDLSYVESTVCEISQGCRSCGAPQSGVGQLVVFPSSCTNGSRFQL